MEAMDAVGMVEREIGRGGGKKGKGHMRGLGQEGGLGREKWELEEGREGGTF